MHHVCRALLAALGTICFSGAASAADLLTKAPISPAAPASWTGCYIGGNVGGGWHPVSAFDPTFLVNAGSANGSGVIGGGQDAMQKAMAMTTPEAAVAILRAEDQKRLSEIRNVVIT